MKFPPISCLPLRPAAFAAWLSALVLATTGVTARGADAESLVSNGGFEDWIDFTATGPELFIPKVENNEAPEGFLPQMHAPYEQHDDPTFPSSVTVSKDTAEKHGGSASLKITNEANTDIGVISTGTLPVTPNTAYKVKVWYKGEDIVLNPKSGDGVGVTFHVGEGPDDFWGGFNSSARRPELYEGTIDWTEHEFEFTTLDSTTKIRVTCQLRRASGTVWFDDFEITPVGQ